MTPIAIAKRPLLAAAVRLLDSAALPSSDLTDAHMEHFFYAGPATQPFGIAGVELHGPVALLRSLVVSEAHRSTGLGRALVDRAEQYARSMGAQSIYLLTTTAEGFFARRGYVPVARESAPMEIRSTREFADICPASSSFMVKPLGDAYATRER